MTTEHKSSSGATGGSSGSDENQNEKSLADRLVALEQKNKELLSEKKRETALRAESDAKVKAFEDEKTKIEEEKLREKGEYQKLHEQEKKAREEARAELDLIKRQISDSRKISMVKNHLGGQIKDEYLVLIDPEAIHLDEQTGEPNLEAVKKYAAEFSTKYAEIIFKSGQRGKMPNDAAIGGEIVPSYDEWREGIKSRDPKVKAQMRSMTSKVIEKHGTK